MRAKAEALTGRGKAAIGQLQRRRSRHASVEIGFRWLIRDREVAGGVLGGGLAYRLFFWVLALSVLLCGGLGLAASSGDNVRAIGNDAGLSNAVTGAIATAAHESQSGRWWLIGIGGFLTLWFSWSLLRSLRLVHAAAWRVQMPALRNAPRALACVLLTAVAFVVLAGTAAWVRGHSPIGLGIIATLAAGLGFAAIWIMASAGLPAEDDAPWHAFLPGAVLLGFAAEGLHLLTAYYLAWKLASASFLYGTLGLAGATLVYLYVIGRCIPSQPNSTRPPGQ